MAARSAAHQRRLAGSLTVGVALAALAGCGSVPGTGSADPSDVAAYQTTLASSRAAAAATAGKSACAAWQAGYDTRIVATRATIAFTKDPKWTWDSIASTLTANIAAVTTESTKLTGVIATAVPNPNIHTLLVDYKTKLDAYGAAQKADQAARGLESQTWPRTNPANDALVTATKALDSACR